MASDGQERTEQATAKRRLDARRKGTVAKSADLTNALVLFSLALALPMFMSSAGGSMLRAFQAGLARIPSELSIPSLQRFASVFLWSGALFLGPPLAVALVVGLLANFAQVGFVLSAEALVPTFAKLNPWEGLKRLLSLRAMTEGIKAIFKFALFGAVAYGAVKQNWPAMLQLGKVQPAQAASMVGAMIATVVLRISLVWLIVAAIDYGFQRKQVDRQLRMTKEEVKREHKEQETSPEMKAAQGKRRSKLSRGRMRDQVKQADVVITNPTHYAVAIQYDPKKAHAPIVLAKGQDYMALAIREVAQKESVPIVPNPPLARSLYKQCEIGDFVPREMFQAVAEVLAYVFKAIGKAKDLQNQATNRR